MSRDPLTKWKWETPLSLCCKRVHRRGTGLQLTSKWYDCPWPYRRKRNNTHTLTHQCHLQDSATDHVAVRLHAIWSRRLNCSLFVASDWVITRHFRQACATQDDWLLVVSLGRAILQDPLIHCKYWFTWPQEWWMSSWLFQYHLFQAICRIFIYY